MSKSKPKHRRARVALSLTVDQADAVFEAALENLLKACKRVR
jgi:hypothetical protein